MLASYGQVTGKLNTFKITPFFLSVTSKFKV